MTADVPVSEDLRNACPMCGATLGDERAVPDGIRYAGLSSPRTTVLFVAVAFLLAAIDVARRVAWFVWSDLDPDIPWLYQEISVGLLKYLGVHLLALAGYLILAGSIWRYATFLKSLQSPGLHESPALPAYRLACVATVTLVTIKVVILGYWYSAVSK